MTSETNNPLAVEFCGMHFQTPLVLLSGCVGFGEEYTRVEGYSNADVGAVCLKGTTGEKRLGNAPHRIYETPAGMLNAIGLQNPWRVRTGEPRPAGHTASLPPSPCHWSPPHEYRHTFYGDFQGHRGCFRSFPDRE